MSNNNSVGIIPLVATLSVSTGLPRRAVFDFLCETYPEISGAGEGETLNLDPARMDPSHPVYSSFQKELSSARTLPVQIFFFSNHP